MRYDVHAVPAKEATYFVVIWKQPGIYHLIDISSLSLIFSFYRQNAHPLDVYISIMIRPSTYASTLAANCGEIPTSGNIVLQLFGYR